MLDHHTKILLEEAIDKVEQAITKKYGPVYIGAELECQFSDTPDFSPHAKEVLPDITDARKHQPFTDDEYIPYVSDHDLSALQKGQQSLQKSIAGSDDFRVAEPVKRIIRIHKERKNKIEVIFNHDVPKRGNAKYLARSIEATKNNIRKIAEKENLYCSFAGSGLPFTNGLHVNVSIKDHLSKELLGDELPYEPGKQDIYRIDQVMNGMLPTLQENLLAFSPTQKDLNRYFRESTADQYACQYIASAQDRDKHALAARSQNEENFYIENRLGSADCDPHFAILIQLVALYDALEKGALTAKREDFKPLTLRTAESLPKTLQEVEENFAKGHILKDVLNEISGDELGNRVHKAIIQQMKLEPNAIMEGFPVPRSVAVETQLAGSR